MKLKLYILVFLLLSSTFVVGQVSGIETLTPKSTLDIASKNPANPSTTDGILVPRFSKFVFTPTLDQHTMVAMLTVDSWTGGPYGYTYFKGLHYWDDFAESGGGDWIPFKQREKLAKTLYIQNFFSDSFPSLYIGTRSLIVMDCVEFRLEWEDTARLQFQARSTCGNQTDVQFTFNKGWGPAIGGAHQHDEVTTNVSTSWTNIHQFRVYLDEMFQGYIYFPDLNRTYQVNIGGNINVQNSVSIYIEEM